MTTIYDLPQPNHESLMRSKALTECIRQKFDMQNNNLSFAEFMESALYHPQFGYYNAENFQIGERGDFTTAPEISPLFAQCFANQIKQIADHLKNYSLLELGAGSGQLAKDLLTQLDKLNCLPSHYYIYEISSSLREQQKLFLQKNCPDFFSKIIWLETLPTNFIGVIIANEVLDALPVNCFCIEKNIIKEKKVCWENNKFEWIITSSTSETFNQQTAEIKNLYFLEDGYASEINLHMQSFIKSLAEILSQGIILFADYGYGQREYYHPERRQGTLTCFYQHRQHNNPLIFPGLQDITAHVDFTRVIEIANNFGCSLAGFTSQSAFLFSCGLMDFAGELEKKLSTLEQFKLNQAIKLLTLPTEMGERIKIMALSKNINMNKLLGFSFQDRRRDL